MPALRDLDALTGEPMRGGQISAVRYERARPGASLVHIDAKKLGRIPEGGGGAPTRRVMRRPRPPPPGGFRRGVLSPMCARC